MPFYSRAFQSLAHGPDTRHFPTSPPQAVVSTLAPDTPHRELENSNMIYDGVASSDHSLEDRQHTREHWMPTAERRPL